MRRLLAVLLSAAVVAVLVPPRLAYGAGPPANDAFADAATVSSTIFGGSTFGATVDVSAATSETDEPLRCGRTTGTAWYAFTAAATGAVTVRITGASFADPRLTTFVFTGRGGFGGGISNGLCGTGTEVTMPVQTDRLYWIQVFGGGSTGGEVSLRVSFSPPPANDAFANATPITAFPFATALEMTPATREVGEGMYCIPAGVPFAGTVWYQFTAPANGIVTVDPTGSTPSPPIIAVLQSITSGLMPQCIGYGAPGSLVVHTSYTYYLQVTASVPGAVTTGIPRNVALAVTFEPFTDTVPPVLMLPSTVTAEATGPLGAVATFDTSAVDAHDGPLPVLCSPQSGSQFPLGDTIVSCYAEDASFNVSVGWFVLSVIDSTPPLLTLPADITTDVTSIAGAAVSYSTSAADDVDGALPVSCLPSSGSVFPIGATTVSCSATDGADNQATGSFVVTVVVTYPGMKSLTNRMMWKAGIADQLVRYLDAAYKAEARGNLKAEASNLDSYRSLLKAQMGKSVSADDAQTLIDLSHGL